MDGETIAGLDLDQHIERGRGASFKDRFLGAAPARLLIRQRDCFDPADEIAQGWVEEQIIECLAEFGFGSLNLTTDDFTTLDRVVQLGYPPYRIDIITSISGVEFENAWANRWVIDVDGMQVPFIGRDDLLKNKRATGRPKDLLDVERLTGN